MTTVRPARTNSKADAQQGGALTGYEAELWRMADALRGSMDAAEYKHVVLGLIFLKYISDAFQELHAWLASKTAEGYDPEDMDEYRGESIFWVPPEARWPHLKAQARQPVIGQLVDDAMAAVERNNPALRDVLPKDYARPALDKTRLGQLIDLITNIQVGDSDARSKDVLGRVYEYFLSQFASAEGKKGGEFYTPRCVVKLLWRCWNPTRAASTTHAAAPLVCSSSRWSSSMPTPPETATAARRGATSPSGARSPTTPPGGWPE